MPILTSKITFNSLQKSGLRDIVECHTDHTGKEYRFFYSVPDKTDLTQRLKNRVSSIEENIKQREIEAAVNVIENGEEITLGWCTWSEVKEHLITREAEKDIEIIKATNEKARITNKISEVEVK